MSYWTHITGMVRVCPMGRTQAEKEYILKTVLEHLPVVSGSEGDMHIHIIQKADHNSSQNCDEFLYHTNNLEEDPHGGKSRFGWMYLQDTYFLLLEADLRDRMFAETYREFIKWLSRLAKRVQVTDVLVKITSDDHKTVLIEDGNEVFADMYEDPSWAAEKGAVSHNWCEYLMWKQEPNT